MLSPLNPSAVTKPPKAMFWTMIPLRRRSRARSGRPARPVRQASRGAPGPAGTQGPAGEVDLVTCKPVTNTRINMVKSRKRKLRTTVMKYSAKLVTGPVTFTKAAGDHTMTATLTHGRVVYAAGRATVGAATTSGFLTPRRRLAAGRYKLRRIWAIPAAGVRRQRSAADGCFRRRACSPARIRASSLAFPATGELHVARILRPWDLLRLDRGTQLRQRRSLHDRSEGGPCALGDPEARCGDRRCGLDRARQSHQRRRAQGLLRIRTQSSLLGRGPAGPPLRIAVPFASGSIVKGRSCRPVRGFTK